jgi:hypothetical protein
VTTFEEQFPPLKPFVHTTTIEPNTIYFIPISAVETHCVDKQRVINTHEQFNSVCLLCGLLIKKAPYCWEKHLEEKHKERYEDDLRFGTIETNFLFINREDETKELGL